MKHLAREGTPRTLALAAVMGVLALVLAACGGSEGSNGDEGAEPTGSEQIGGGAAGSSAGSLVIQADMVWGPTNIPEEERGSSVCVMKSRYPRNSEVVWRARVIDGATGDQLDDTALDSLTVTLADGQSFDMRYGGHPHDDPLDFFWTTSWDIPMDYATGTVDFDIEAVANDGRTATFAPFQVAASQLTVTDEVLQTIEEEEG